MQWWNASLFHSFLLSLLQCCFDIHEVIIVYSFTEWKWVECVECFKIYRGTCSDAVWVYITEWKMFSSYCIWMCQHYFVVFSFDAFFCMNVCLRRFVLRLCYIHWFSLWLILLSMQYKFCHCISFEFSILHFCIVSSLSSDTLKLL